jgi:hypothetical protein
VPQEKLFYMRHFRRAKIIAYQLREFILPGILGAALLVVLVPHSGGYLQDSSVPGKISMLRAERIALSIARGMVVHADFDANAVPPHWRVDVVDYYGKNFSSGCEIWISQDGKILQRSSFAP